MRNSETCLSPARASLLEAAMLGIPTPLADERGAFGPLVMPLTPWHRLVMIGLGAIAFTRAAEPRGADGLKYLWWCSPEFRELRRGNPPDTWRARLRYRIRIGRFARRWAAHVAYKGFLMPRFAEAIEAHAATMFFEADQFAGCLSRRQMDGAHELLCWEQLGIAGERYWHTPIIHLNHLLRLRLTGRAGVFSRNN
jgi:hypothetical protein